MIRCEICGGRIGDFDDIVMRLNLAKVAHARCANADLGPRRVLPEYADSSLYIFHSSMQKHIEESLRVPCQSSP